MNFKNYIYLEFVGKCAYSGSMVISITPSHKVPVDAFLKSLEAHLFQLKAQHAPAAASSPSALSLSKNN